MINITQLILSIIAANGSIPIDKFFMLASDYYYSNFNGIGKKGDFITAPEAGQLFGEMIGIYIAEQWYKYKQPFVLIELGPGAGSLMADVLRVMRHISDVHGALQKVILVEKSEKLQVLQKHSVMRYLPPERIMQYNTLRGVFNAMYNSGCICIIIANEFFDALPIKQFVYQNHDLHEVLLTSDGNKLLLCIDKHPITPNLQQILIQYYTHHLHGIAIDKDHSNRYLSYGVSSCDSANGRIVEISPKCIYHAELIAQLLQIYSGTAVIIDYGYYGNGLGKSTLQAMRQHTRSYFLDNIGQSDITALVDFSVLENVFKRYGFVTRLTRQQEFLATLGIKIRAQDLISKGASSHNIISQLELLLSPEKMGTLFKVLEVAN